MRTCASSVADAAVALNEQGLAVLAVHPTSKRPLHRGGVHSASTDPDVTRARFRAFPNAAVALATGRGLAAVDIDPKHGGTVSPDWTATLTAETPSGGRHLYYRAALPVPYHRSLPNPGNSPTWAAGTFVCDSGRKEQRRPRYSPASRPTTRAALWAPTTCRSSRSLLSDAEAIATMRRAHARSGALVSVTRR